MKRNILVFIVLLISQITFSQVQTHVVGDSIFMHSNNGPGELILQNGTQKIPGFLFNKGDGKTEFRRGLVRINDSLYLIGADSLRINNNNGSNNGKNVFYVSKKYIGTAEAVIKSTSLPSISSINSSYMAQLKTAVPGSLVNTYPDPFSARNAALDAISSGLIPQAEVVVLDGNSYTIGFTDSSKNGSIDGKLPNSNVPADIQFDQSSLSSDQSLASIMKNNVDMYFGNGCVLTYINSSSNIYCYYEIDSTEFKSNILGEGSFYQVYGEVNGFVATFSSIRSPGAKTNFHAHEVILQQWQGFNYQNFSIANLDIDNLITTDASAFIIGGSKTIDGTSPIMHIKVKNLKFGRGQTPYPDSYDWWYLILANTSSTEPALITLDIDNLYMKSSDFSPLFYVGTLGMLNNMKLTVNINNLIQRDSHIAYSSGFGMIGWYLIGPSTNNTFTFNIHYGDIDAPLIGSINSSYAGSYQNRIIINADYLQKNPSSFSNGIFNMTNIGPMGGEPMSIKVNGYFKSYDNGPIIFTRNEYPDGYCLPLVNHYQFSGRYQTTSSGVPVIHLYHGMGKNIGLNDAILINDNTVNTITAESPNTPIYIKNVHATAGMDANVIFTGDVMRIVSDILSYIN